MFFEKSLILLVNIISLSASDLPAGTVSCGILGILYNNSLTSISRLLKVDLRSFIFSLSSEVSVFKLAAFSIAPFLYNLPISEDKVFIFEDKLSN